MRRVVMVLLLVACSKKASVDDGPAQRFPIVPDSVMGQLGAVGFVLAVDLHRLDLTRVRSMIPDDLACLNDIARDAKAAVITVGIPETWEARVTGLTAAGIADCVGKTAKVFGVAVTHEADDSTTLAIPGNPLSLVWKGDQLVITEKGERQRYGDPPGVITDLLHQVPRDVKGWIVGSGFPKYKIKSMVAWLETTDSVWTFTINAESTEAGAAKPWVESVTRGFRAAADAKGVAVDDKWFTITSSTPTTAKLVAAIPIGAFVPTRSP